MLQLVVTCTCTLERQGEQLIYYTQDNCSDCLL